MLNYDIDKKKITAQLDFLPEDEKIREKFIDSLLILLLIN